MKITWLLLFSVFIYSCAKESAELHISHGQLQMQGRATTFHSDNLTAFNNALVVENSLVNFSGQNMAFFDEGGLADLKSAFIGTDGSSFTGKKTLATTNHRFSYVLNYNNILYCFANQGGSIFLEKSTDGVNWTLMNNGNSVLDSETDINSLYHFVWNVAVDVDDNGVWQMFIESSDFTGNSYAGLTHSTATMNGDLIEFNTNKSATFVIPEAGSPYVRNVPGKGLLLFYGKMDENFWWSVAAGTFVNNIFTEDSNFKIGAPNIHVCDPHALQLEDGRTLMSMSFDQDSTYLAYSNMSLEQIFDSLDQ